MNTFGTVSGDTISLKPSSCLCGLCLRASDWPENGTRYDTDEILLGSTSDSLSRQIMDIYESRKQVETTRWAKENFRQQVQETVNQMGGTLNSPMVVIIGSTKYELALDDSDLDLCITTSRPFVYNKTTLLNSIGQALKKRNIIHSEPFVEGKQRQILKFMAGDMNRRFRVDVQIKDLTCDMNREEPIVNTNLIASLASVDRRFVVLATIVKIWAKKQGIHDAREWRLSSYNLALIVIQYLQVGCNPPILPVVKSSTAQEAIDMFRYKHYCSSNRQSLGVLLMGFFRFYSEQFDFAKQFVSTNRSEHRCRFHLPLYSKYYIHIEEPISKRNTATSVRHIEIYQRIKSAFGASYRLLTQHDNLNLIL